MVESIAELLDDPMMSMRLPEYVEKYGAMMQDMGYTPEAIAAEFLLGFRVTPTKIRSWAWERRVA